MVLCMFNDLEHESWIFQVEKKIKDKKSSSWIWYFGNLSRIEGNLICVYYYTNHKASTSLSVYFG